VLTVTPAKKKVIELRKIRNEIINVMLDKPTFYFFVIRLPAGVVALKWREKSDDAQSPGGIIPFIK
jgi:hypothetical protein